MSVIGLLAGVASLARSDLPPLVVLVVVGSAVGWLRTVRRARARRGAERRRDQVLAACEGLSADLASGLAPAQALRAMATEYAELRPVVRAIEIGADVPVALRAAAERPGAGSLRVAAAAWSVSTRSGAGLARMIELAADTMRANRATARVVAAELAAARATARLLTLLPGGVLLLGRGMGGDPLAFLLFTTPGQLCLTVGVGLAWCGRLWLERIADQVDPA
jgi:tight adherence protein B